MPTERVRLSRNGLDQEGWKVGLFELELAFRGRIVGREGEANAHVVGSLSKRKADNSLSSQSEKKQRRRGE